jgi:hypothetical protein
MIRILLAIALMVFASSATTAYARDRFDPAYQGGDITVCRGLLTSSGTCIWSESNVEPDSYDGVTIYRRHRDRDDRDDDRRQGNDADRD